jgi:hypothetical protein
MYGTGEAILFFVVFASQILLISWLYPRRVVGRERHVLQNYPPSAYPKMYPQPVEYYERRLRNYERLNRAIVVVGFSILVALIVGTFGTEWDGAIVTPWSTSGEWDAALLPFFLLQVAPIPYFALSALKHQKAMAKAAPRVRTTDLQRRRLVNVVPPAMLITVVLVNVAYIAFVLWYRRFEFSWFTATGNIALVAVMLIWMGGCVLVMLRSPRADHYQAQQDRLAAIRLMAKAVAAFCIAVPVVTAAQLIVKIYDPDFLEPVIVSLHAQVVMLALLWPASSSRTDKIDFDVYKRDAQDSPAPTSARASSPRVSDPGALPN